MINSRKSSKKSVKKGKQRSASALTERLYRQLCALFPKARKSSVFHLTIALAHKYRSFVTDDSALLKQSANIEKIFHIKIMKTIYEHSRYSDQIAEQYLKNRFSL